MCFVYRPERQEWPVDGWSVAVTRWSFEQSEKRGQPFSGTACWVAASWDFPASSGESLPSSVGKSFPFPATTVAWIAVHFGRTACCDGERDRTGF